MPYLEKRYYIKNRIEVEQIHSSMYGNHAPRIKRWKVTPEDMKIVNTRRREKGLRRLIDLNFEKGDCYYTFTYRKGERYSLKDAKKHIRKMIERLRYQYKKRKKQLKWIWTWGVTKTGKPHHHMIINFVKDIPYADVIRKYFPYGKVVNEWMYEEGNFEKLAEYIIKHKDERKDAEEGQTPSYCSSRNLKRPRPKVIKKIKEEKLTKPPRIPKGFELHMKEGDQGVTGGGYRYRFYTLIRIEDKKRRE